MTWLVLNRSLQRSKVHASHSPTCSIHSIRKMRPRHVHFKHFIIFSTLTSKQPHKPKSKKEHARACNDVTTWWCHSVRSIKHTVAEFLLLYIILYVIHKLRTFQFSTESLKASVYFFYTALRVSSSLVFAGLKERREGEGHKPTPDWAGVTNMLKRKKWIETRPAQKKQTKKTKENKTPKSVWKWHHKNPIFPFGLAQKGRGLGERGGTVHAVADGGGGVGGHVHTKAKLRKC